MSFPVPLLGAFAGDRPPEPVPIIFWFAADASGGSQLWSDTARTVPAGLGAPVAAITSDEGVVFWQTNAARRPSRTGDGRGLVFVKASNHYLITPAAEPILAAVSGLERYTMMVAGQFQAIGTALAFGPSDDIEVAWRPYVPPQYPPAAHARDGGETLFQTFAPDQRNVIVTRRMGLGLSDGLRITTAAGTVTANSPSSLPEAFTVARIGDEIAGAFNISIVLYEVIIYSDAMDDGAAANLVNYARARWSI